MHLEQQLEDAIIFLSFATVTDISHWVHAHEELQATLANVRQLAHQGLLLVDKKEQSAEQLGTVERDGREEEGKKRLVEELTGLAGIVLPHFGG